MTEALCVLSDAPDSCRDEFLIKTERPRRGRPGGALPLAVRSAPSRERAEVRARPRREDHDHDEIERLPGVPDAHERLPRRRSAAGDVESREGPVTTDVAGGSKSVVGSLGIVSESIVAILARHG